MSGIGLSRPDPGPRRPRFAGACHDPAMPIDASALLAVGLRSRARTVTELAALAVRDEDDVRRDLAVLEADGYLTVRDDRISYLAPDGVVAEQVRAHTGSIGADLSRRLDELAELVGQLPALLREWNTGEASHQLVDVEVFHGPEAVVDLWHLKQEREPSMRTDVVLPDASRLHVADPAMQKVWHEASAGEGRRARVIGSVADAIDPDAQQRLEQELAGGIQIRLMAEPPSWFWIADDVTVALPLVWGEKWPTSVIAVHSRAVAGLARWVFDRLWERAVPARGEPAAWDPILRLMRGGATLEAASRLLGISDRTGRRRLSDAMDHYGVNNMFALGAAWSAHQH